MTAAQLQSAENAAFPGGGLSYAWTGLSKRELFAALAMHAFLTSANTKPPVKPNAVAESSVAIADAMIAQLAANPDDAG